MMLLKLLTLLLIFSVVTCDDELMYEGLRVDISALTFNRDILASITPALNRTLNHTFAKLTESGSFGTSLTISSIKITQPILNENRFHMQKYEFNRPIYNLNGDFGCILFHLSFQYSLTWIGIPLASGKGIGSVVNMAMKVLVFFNETDPDVQLPHPWDVTNISTSFNFIDPSAWIESLLESKFITEFHKVIDDAMFDFAHELLKTYRKLEDIYGDVYDLVFYNEIIDVKPTVDKTYLSIAFDTNITVNKNIAKNMYRRITGTVSPQSDFSLCFAAQLIPDTFDCLGKAGYYNKVVDPREWGFDDNTVNSLLPILPALSKKYQLTDTFKINCQLSPFETVNDVAEKRGTVRLLEMQLPDYCSFVMDVDFSQPLFADIFSRLFYKMKANHEAFEGIVLAAELFGFKAVPILPVEKAEILRNHVLYHVRKYEETELIGPGIKVEPNRKSQLIFYGANTKSDEICFAYAEVRPVLSPNPIS